MTNISVRHSDIVYEKHIRVTRRSVVQHNSIILEDLADICAPSQMLSVINT